MRRGMGSTNQGWVSINPLSKNAGRITTADGEVTGCFSTWVHRILRQCWATILRHPYPGRGSRTRGRDQHTGDRVRVWRHCGHELGCEEYNYLRHFLMRGNVGILDALGIPENNCWQVCPGWGNDAICCAALVWSASFGSLSSALGWEYLRRGDCFAGSGGRIAEFVCRCARLLTAANRLRAAS